MNNVTVQTTIGEMVKQRPARSRVFEKLGLDYCCGGKLPLADACAKSGLDAQRVLAEVVASDNQSLATTDDLIDADTMKLSDLADHIQTTHHAYLKQELPRLGFMVRKVAAVHGDNHAWMIDVDSVFGAFAAEMQSHMVKEEGMLFPLIRSMGTGQPGPAHACGTGLAAPIRAMEHEHDNAGNAMERIRALCDNYTPPEGACNTFRAMLDGLQHLEKDMHQHVHKENNVLFPKALAFEKHCNETAGA